MQRSIRFTVLSIVLLVLGLSIGPAGAQEAPESPEVAACLPGAGYASGCDVDQDGDVDIFDPDRRRLAISGTGAVTGFSWHPNRSPRPRHGACIVPGIFLDRIIP